MKKRLLTFVCAFVLLFGLSVNTLAADSPTGTKDTTTTTNKATTSPKTGENDVLFYGIAGVVLLSGAVIVSRKRLEEMK